MRSTMKSKARLSQRGLINIPVGFLDAAGIDISAPVWIITDGDIMVIKNIFNKSHVMSPSLFSRLSGAFKKLVSR